MQAHFGYKLMDHGCCDIPASKHEQLLISMRSMEGLCFRIIIAKCSYLTYFHIGLEALPLDCGEASCYVPQTF